MKEINKIAILNRDGKVILIRAYHEFKDAKQKGNDVILYRWLDGSKVVYTNCKLIDIYER